MKPALIKPRLIFFVLIVAFVAVAPHLHAAGTASSSPQLEAVLNKMDATAAAFKTTQAEFTWDQFQQVVNEHDIQKGKMYFRRLNKGVEMAADITEPEKKYVLFTDSKVRVYQPKIDQVTEYNTGKNRADFESFLVLGFGGRGHDLPKTFDVHYLGNEDIQGVHTAKLELVPKSQRVRNTFSRILLWIDNDRGVSVQQQFFDPAGDYRIASYSNIELNSKIADNVFKLKTTGNTRTVSPGF
jgi:outer membrane lipoprotein-sorting protein